MIEVVWRGIEQASRERCRIDESARGVRVESGIEGEGACSYTLHATPSWEFTALDLRADGLRLAVRRTSQGWKVDGRLRPDLAEAREVDIAASPLSNTLPIRRLGLTVGQGADIVTAYVRVPELTVTTDPQRYTRTGEHEYLYESRDSDFRRRVTVDGHGLVIDYPGLFAREPA